MAGTGFLHLFKTCQFTAVQYISTFLSCRRTYIHNPFRMTDNIQIMLYNEQRITCCFQPIHSGEQSNRICGV